MPFSPADVYEVWNPTGGGPRRELLYSCDDQTFAMSQRDNNWPAAEVWHRVTSLGLVAYTFIS